MNHNRSNDEVIVLRGELVSRRAAFIRSASVILPSVVWIFAFLVIPSTLMLLLAFMSRGAEGQIEWAFTLENWRRLAGYGLEGWSTDYLWILARSIWIAAATTAISIFLAYPTAFYITSRAGRMRYVWLALIVIPMCVNLVIRTYAWQLILSHQLPFARLAHALGFIGEGESLYPSAFAVYLGMVAHSLPFAILPLYASVERLDGSLIEAARDLYAGRWGVFRHAILPQTAPGLMTAAILTFIPALGIFVIPDLLGGSKTMLVGNLMQQQFGPSRDWPFGSAVGCGLTALTLLGLFAMGRSGQQPKAGETA